MKRNELNSVLASAGVKPNRKLGQNFLIDDNFLDWIVRESGAAPGVKIIEVGPGFGALTSKMLEAGAEVTAVEFDSRIAGWLRKNLCPKGLKLVECDACRFNFESVYGKGVDYKLVSNLPYSAGTVIVANFLESETPPSQMLVMLQKEVALRLAADAGNDEYGSLSVRANTTYKTEPLRIAPPEMFHPRPEVDSCVIRMTRRSPLPERAFRLAVSKVARIGFSQRRKKMIKQLAGIFTRPVVEKAYAELGLKEDIRAERVTVAQFAELAKIFARTAPAAENTAEENTGTPHA